MARFDPKVDKDQLKGVHNWLSFDKEFIIYNDQNNGNDESGWEYHRQLEQDAGTKLFNSLKAHNNFDETIDAGHTFLETFAKAERSKEELWLKSLYPYATFPQDEVGYIKTINELYNNEEKLKKILSRLLHNLEYNLQIAEENKSLPKDQKKSTLRAPSMIANYVNYFSSALRDWMENYVVQAKTMQDLETLVSSGKLWNKGFKEATMVAFEKIAAASHSEDSKYFGEGEDYYELVELMQQDSSFRKFFYNEIDMTNVRKKIIEQLRENKGKKMIKYRHENGDLLPTDRDKRQLMKVDMIKHFVTKAYDDKGNETNPEQRTRQLAGHVQEYVKNMLLKAEITTQGKKSKGQSLSNINATDTLIFQTEVTADISEAYDILIKATNGGSQAEIAKELKKFYQNRVRSKKSIFVVNISNKLYTLTEDHHFKKAEKVSNLGNVLKHNFTSTAGGGLKTLPGFGWLTNSRDIHILISLIYNTINGAFLDDQRGDVIDTLRQMLAIGAANLLFSDYYNVGDKASEGINAVHLFDLDDIYIPLSVILQGMADAFGEAKKNKYTDYIQISSFNTKDLKILYPKTSENITKEERYGNILMSEAWNTQRDKVRQDASFEIKFANNFQKIIKMIAQEYQMINVQKNGKFDFL